MQQEKAKDDRKSAAAQRTDGSVERLRADIDRGRTGDKVDWPDPAAAPLGTDAEAGGAPVNARTGRAVHRAETVRSGVPRQGRRGFGAAWVVVVVAVVIAAVIIGWFAACPLPKTAEGRAAQPHGPSLFSKLPAAIRRRRSASGAGSRW